MCAWRKEWRRRQIEMPCLYRRAMARRGTGSGTSCTELGTFAPRVAGLPLLCCRSTAALPTPKAKWQRTNPIRSTINIKDKDPSFKIRRVITFLALFDPIRPPDARTANG